MNGLILKDFYILCGMYRKNLTMVALLYGAMYLFLDMDVFLYMFTVMSVFYTLSTFTLDDAAKWDRYARTLPVSADQIVGGKWLVSIGFIFISCLYSLVLGAVGSLIHGSSYLEIAASVGGTALVALLIDAIMLPTTMKFGPDKARNTMLLLFAAIFLGFFALAKALAGNGFAISLPAISPVVGVGLALVILAVILLVCYRISCRIYAAKEF